MNKQIKTKLGVLERSYGLIKKSTKFNMDKKIKTSNLIKNLLRRLDSGFGKWRCKALNLDCAACQAELLRAGLNWWYELEIWDGKTFSKKSNKSKLSIK